MGDAVVILAAGASKRFGSPKQLALWRGRPLIRHAIEEALAVRSNVIAVLGAHAPRVEQAIFNLPCRRIYAEGWQRGPGASIKAAVAALPKMTTRALISLVDLPLVDRFTFRRLFDSPGVLVASSYTDTVGVPAVFASELFGELLQLDDSQGAKVLLNRHFEHLTRVENPEAEEDVDTPEALAVLDESQNPRGGIERVRCTVAIEGVRHVE